MSFPIRTPMIAVALAFVVGPADAGTQVYGDMCIVSGPDHPKVRAIAQPYVGTSLRLGERLYLIRPDGQIEVLVGTRLTDTARAALQQMDASVRAACAQARTDLSDGRRK